MPILKISSPATVIMVFNLLIPIITYDVFDEFEPLDKLLTFDDKKLKFLAEENIDDQMSDLGYESNNSM